nr:MAG TPA: hypothetical protein [Caudoviricetes sp.]
MYMCYSIVFLLCLCNMYMFLVFSCCVRCNYYSYY